MKIVKLAPPKEKIETASLPQTSCKYDSEGFRARILNVSRVLEIGSDLVSDEHSVQLENCSVGLTNFFLYSLTVITTTQDTKSFIA